MANLRFEQLPEAVSQILTTLQRVEELLLEKHVAEENSADLLNVTEAAAFLNLTVSTIYTKVCRGEIPALKPGRRLYFDKKELIDWIKSHRKRDNNQIATEAKFMVSRSSLPFHRKKKAFRMT